MNVPFRLSMTAMLALGLASGCASHEESGRKSAAAQVEPEPEDPELEPVRPEPVVAAAKVSVASVQLQDDCRPDRSAGAHMGQQGESMDDALGRRSIQKTVAGCVQSRVSFAITSEADEPLTFAVMGVRLKTAGKVVAEMTTRDPQVWSDSKFEPWDQSVAAGAQLNVGYSLGGPDWGAVGGDSWAPLYELEIDVDIGGESRTLESPVAPRDEPNNMVT